MLAKWRRGDQDQMNVKPTDDMVGPAGTVFVAAGRGFITLEDVTAEMVTAGTPIGVAVAGIWEFPNSGVAFTQFANVLVTAAGAIGTTGTFIGIAENAVGASDTSLMVCFDSFGKSAT